ncbi:ras family domain-containing protein [Ditylenchus destructor]|nr:ras family domain-containing protein [Ditylenchus destructor]
MEDYKYLFKVVLVGNAGVGKTCLVRKFTQGIFPPGQSATIGVDFMIKTVKVDDDKIKLQIWDTAGQERFRSITQSYYRSAHAIVLVYDVACQPSFDCLPEWLSEIEQYANRKVFKLLVGNKVDKEDEREVPERVGQNFADSNGFDYFVETSALDATNVDALFQEVATRLTNEMKVSDDRYHGYKPSNTSNQSRTLSLLDRAQNQQALFRLSTPMSNAKGGERRKRPAAPAKQLTESSAEVDQPGAQSEKLESMRRELELLKEMVVACASGRRSEPDSSNGS